MKRVACLGSLLFLAIDVAVSVLDALVYYYTTEISILETIGGLLIETLVGGFFLGLFLLDRRYRTRLTYFMGWFFIAVLFATCLSLYVLAGHRRFSVLLATLLPFGGMGAAAMVDILCPRKAGEK